MLNFFAYRAAGLVHLLRRLWPFVPTTTSPTPTRMDPLASAPFDATIAPATADYPATTTPATTDPVGTEPTTTDPSTTEPAPAPSAPVADAPSTDPTATTPAPAPVPTASALDQLGQDMHADFEQLKNDTQQAVDAIIDKAKQRIEEFKNKVGDLLAQL